jgi:hypothetical protein
MLLSACKAYIILLLLLTLPQIINLALAIWEIIQVLTA